MKNLLLTLALLLSTASASGKESKSYLMSLSSADRTAIEDKLEEIKRREDGLVQLSQGNGHIFLIIHGIDFPSYPEEWVIPFGQLILNEHHSYLHKWSNRVGLEKNRELFLASLTVLLNKFPDQKIIIFGYSAGGAISLLALDSLSGTPAMERIFLHTVASPFFGFEAPTQAYVAAPFVGRGRIEIGMGAYSFMKTKNFQNCHHWVTTNCSLDKNSCPGEKINPQTGPLNGTVEMPCGNSEVTKIDDETHTSVITSVMEKLIP